MQRMRRPRDRTGGLYQPGFTAEELRSLAVSRERPLLDDEVDLLRLLIRRMVGDEAEVEESIDIEAIGRLVDRLGRLLRTRKHVVLDSTRNQSDIELMLKASESALSDWTDELRERRTRSVSVAKEPVETPETTPSMSKEIA